ncbi:MAG: hypothetical protein HOH43_25860 [Candidatus Latescibacteria bacterium]|nr:hypothetical protein [Candidatus Latescibacterota bacterium]
MRPTVVFLLLSLSTFTTALAQNSGDRLSLSEFDNTQHDSSLSWLQLGVADMLSEVLSRSSQFDVAEQVLAIPQSNRSADESLRLTIESARRARAQYLITGSFVSTKGILTLRAALHRVSDDMMILEATWDGIPDSLIQAVNQLSSRMMDGGARELPSNTDSSIPSNLPPTLDVAEAFYQGRTTFDNGQYEEAIEWLESGAHDAGSFLPLHQLLTQVYERAGEPEMAVRHGLETANRLRREDIAHALPLLYQSAIRTAYLVKDTTQAIQQLRLIDSLAVQYEKESSATLLMRRQIMDRALELRARRPTGTLTALLRSSGIRHRFWTTEIEDQMSTPEYTRGYEWQVENGRRTKVPIDVPTVFMWRIRALLTAGRLSIGMGNPERGLAAYRDILDAYDFLRQMPGYSESERIYWIQGIELEAHFMILHHYRRTGDLIRDPRLTPKINVVSEARYFMRDFGDMAPDVRARVWSRQSDGGHEYFDFSAPPGYQIDAVIPGAHVDGMVKCNIYLPDAQGWPPEFDFSRRHEQVTWFGGTHSTRIDLPPGTQFVSSSVLWGKKWANTPWEWLKSGLSDIWGTDSQLTWWEARFVLSPLHAGSVVGEIESKQLDQSIVKTYATDFGWDDGQVLRAELSQEYTGGESMGWTTVSEAGDIVVISQADPLVRARLPATINTRAQESYPELVQDSDGAFLLCWNRTSHTGVDDQFFSKTRDFQNWEIPRRMRFRIDVAPVPRNVKRQTTNIISTESGYLMMLGDGYTRYATDPQEWDAPVKQFHHDARGLLITGRDGTAWSIGVQHLNEMVVDGTDLDSDYGYYTSADGNRWRKADAITVASRQKGGEWSAERVVNIGNEISGLWAFARDDDRIGLAVGYHNVDLVWISVGREDETVARDVLTRLLPDGTDSVRFFINSGAVACIRTVRDFRKERQVIILQQSNDVYRQLYR